MGTHKIYLCGEIRKIFYGYPLSSGARLYSDTGQIRNVPIS